MFRKHCTGMYRLTINADQFARIRKLMGAWLVEIRNTNSGDLIQYAGLWPTLRDAKADALRLS